VRYTCPNIDTSISVGSSPLVPPRKVDARRVERLLSSFDTKISLLPPLKVVLMAPAVVGKSVEIVPPVTYTFPVILCMAIPSP